MPFHAEPADAVARWASVTLSCLLEEQHSSAALGAFIESLPATELFRAEAPPPPPPKPAQLTAISQPSLCASSATAAGPPSSASIRAVAPLSKSDACSASR